MKEYLIRITGEYDIIVLTPHMIETLMQKIHSSDTKELVIPAEEILPQGYIEYLARVLSANFDIKTTEDDRSAVYSMVAEQMEGLKLDMQTCFEEVRFSEQTVNRELSLNTDKTVYMLIRRKAPSLSYIYKGLDGRDIRVTLDLI